MDLQINEVSELLNVSESKIKKWIQEGKIPSYKLGLDYRFNRAEIEDWVMKNGSLSKQENSETCQEEALDNEEHQSLGMQQFSLFRALNKGGVYLDCDKETKEDIIRWTTEKLAQKFDWDPEVIAELLIDREELMPTALNNGVGVPHTRDFLIGTHFDAIAVVFTKKPIEYGALDGKPVNTLFFLFACEDKRHLNLLAKLAHLASQDRALELFAKRPSQSELLNFVKDWENSLVKK
jgi:PTS system nitrogen regulatory IIA component